MLLEIQKTEMVEILLDAPKYILFAERIYYRFTPENDTIKVLRFQHEVTSNLSFSLSATKGLYESDIPVLNLTSEFAKEITEDEFNNELQKQLLANI